MEYVEALVDPRMKPDLPRPFVFLAGGITSCPDWQQQIRELLADFPHGTLLNPRRADFPMNDPDAGRLQIKWEFDRLWDDTDIFTMWFSNGSIGPICLLELGAQLSRHKALVDNGLKPPFAAMIVGGDEDYSRRFDVEQQSSLVLGEALSIHTSLETHAELIRSAVRQYNDMLEYVSDDEDDEDEDHDPEGDEYSGDEDEADDQTEDE